MYEITDIIATIRDVVSPKYFYSHNIMIPTLITLFSFLLTPYFHAKDYCTPSLKILKHQSVWASGSGNLAFLAFGPAGICEQYGLLLLTWVYSKTLILLLFFTLKLTEHRREMAIEMVEETAVSDDESRGPLPPGVPYEYDKVFEICREFNKAGLYLVEPAVLLMPRNDYQLSFDLHNDGMKEIVSLVPDVETRRELIRRTLELESAKEGKLVWRGQTSVKV